MTQQEQESGAVQGHTPGPWRADGWCAYGRDIYAGEVWIGDVKCPHPECECPRGFPSTDDETNANARLIAAAPQLLDALNDIIDYDGGADSALDDPYVMQRAREAVDKAEGRAE